MSESARASERLLYWFCGVLIGVSAMAAKNEFIAAGIVAIGLLGAILSAFRLVRPTLSPEIIHERE